MEIVNKEASWEVIGIRMYSTITALSDKKKHTVIVLVAGSNHTDID